MKFSFKGTSAAIRAATALNELYCGKPVAIKDLAAECGFSVSYLEQMFALFRKAGIVAGVRGPGGGYHLRNKDITVADIIRAISGGDTGFLEPVFTALDTVKISEMNMIAEKQDRAA